MQMDGKTKDSERDNSESGLFLKLLLSNETRIFSYILTLVPNFADAEEIMQEASTVMWKSFDQFQPVFCLSEKTIH